MLCRMSDTSIRHASFLGSGVSGALTSSAIISPTWYANSEWSNENAMASAILRRSKLHISHRKSSAPREP